MSIRIISKPFLVAATATVVASGVGVYMWQQQQRPPVLEIYVFALSSGRSIFIRTPDDQRILIDGGGNSQVIRQLTDIIPFYSRRIDKIIVTSTDGKNVSGLVDIVDRYVVDKVYIPTYTLEKLDLASSTDKIFETFLETVEEKKISTTEISAGDELVFGQSVINSNNSSSNVTAKILFPSAPELFDYSKASPPEVLFIISYQNTSITFMGDASKKVQKFVASTSASVIANTDVLIVSHSAATANTSVEFMNSARPTSLIYEKAVTKSTQNNSKPSTKKSSSKTQIQKTSSKRKVIVDPLAAILNEDRFNIKEGTLKIVSDGEGVIITGSNK